MRDSASSGRDQKGTRSLAALVSVHSRQHPHQRDDPVHARRRRPCLDRFGCKYILSGLVIYGGLFLVAPLALVKGWHVVRQPPFSSCLALRSLPPACGMCFEGSAL